MGRERERREIDGVLYECRQLSGFAEGPGYLADLTAVFGEPMVKIITQGVVTDGTTEETMKEIALVAMTTLARNLSSDQIESLSWRVLKEVRPLNSDRVSIPSRFGDAPDGRELAAKEFGGRHMAFLKVWAFALEVNFRDFFEETVGIFQSLSSKSEDLGGIAESILQTSTQGDGGLSSQTEGSTSPA